MTVAILTICAALVPLIVKLWLRYLAKRDDPIQQKLAAKQKADDAIARGDTRALNGMVDDKLRELASRKGDRSGQGH